jgi:hypothetical protein
MTIRDDYRNDSVVPLRRAALRRGLAPLLVLASLAAAAGPLPEGNAGLAAKYPGDVGISSDPSVLFFDDFESYSSASALTTRWNEVYHMENVRIATEAGNFYAGSKALEFKVPQTTAEISNTAVKYVSPQRDVLFLRYYAKFDSAFNVLGSSHNGSTISANYCCPGVSANGYNKFLLSLEAGRETSGTVNPGKLNVYIYYPDQRDIWGDHFYPTGTVTPYSSVPYNFGPEFVSRPDITPQLGRWYSYEVMVKANTPGLKDGRIAFWIDGKLAADFQNVRVRETTDLKIDRFSVDLHIKSNTLGVAKKYYDNVVAATSYIGPRVTQMTLPPAPSNLVVK